MRHEVAQRNDTVANPSIAQLYRLDLSQYRQTVAIPLSLRIEN